MDIDYSKMCLYGATETDFTTNGLGLLNEWVGTPEVKRVINGEYSLKGTYQKGSLIEKQMVHGAVIGCYTPDRSWQLFRIYNPTDTLVTREIFALHVGYDAQRNFIEYSFTSKGSVGSIMGAIKQSLTFAQNVNFTSNVTTTHQFTIKETNPIDAIIGANNGNENLTSVSNTELKMDNFNLSLVDRLGADKGYRVDFGINLLGIKTSIDTNIVNSLYLIGATPEGKYDTPADPITFKYLNAPNMTVQNRTIGSRTNSECKTVAELKAWGQSLYDKDKIHLQKATHEIDMVDLAQLDNYKDLAILVELDIGDTIHVNIPEQNITLEERVVEYDWYPSLVEYKTLVLGNDFDYYTNMVNRDTNSVIQQLQAQQNEMVSRIKTATEYITGQQGGHVIFRPKDLPSEILIMDTADVNTAKKVWRWNLGGLGYSKNGVNGPFETAITQDGAIVADFITVGTLQAGLIKAGFNNIGEIIQIGSTALAVYNGTKKLMELSKNGMQFWKTTGAELGRMGSTGKLDLYGVSGSGSDFTDKSLFIDLAGGDFIQIGNKASSGIALWKDGKIQSSTRNFDGWYHAGTLIAGGIYGNLLADDKGVYLSGDVWINGKKM
ncbi:hypothetical protein HBP99_04285 [Listeria booriae]|uniref:phage tail spike protein n=1 Tax=Listeria booriae TaxID=1552123 RepID=UPI001629A8B8|nr:phage tail spike protein [Listeria booriae]MBC2367838.1 hypothetical protein [Listeria booriae]